MVLVDEYAHGGEAHAAGAQRASDWAHFVSRFEEKYRLNLVDGSEDE